MNRGSWLSMGIVLVAAIQTSLAAPTAIEPFLSRHCFECHDADTAKGGLDLTSLPFNFANAAAHQRWVRVFDRVTAGEMPPSKKSKPGTGELDAFLGTLGADLTAQHAARKGTVLRRLNRREFENTVNDLLGVQVELVPLLPEDGLALGFDNIADALGISGIQMQRTLEAADFALTSTWRTDARPETTTRTFSLDSPRNQPHLGKVWLKRPDGAVVVFTSDAFPSTVVPGFAAPAAGLYRVRVSGYGFQMTGSKPVFSVISGTFHRGGDQETRGFRELPFDRPGTVELTFHLRAGDGIKIKPHGLKGRDGHSPIKDGPDKYPGEGLALLGVEIHGPILDEWPPRGRTLLLGDAKLRELPPNPPWLKNRRDYQPTFTVDTPNPPADARRALKEFLPKAFRRPVSDADAAPYVALFEREFAVSRDYLDAIKSAAIAALCSPDFLYFHEPAGPLDDYALASRLSYFLTRSSPDAELLELASAGKLTRPDVLRSQTERLLSGPGLDRFLVDFTDGWLNLREIDFTTPDKLLYPEFDELLLDSMLRETRGFVRELITENLTITNVIRSDFALLNSRLASHYDIAGVDGLDLRKVSLPPDSRRGGLLTQASVLKVSANGTTTSPVTRGVWVLERILGITPQPPPPGVSAVEPDIRGATTLREILARHRSVESCNGCHRVIDPPGFALESYDAIGGWRDRFRAINTGQPVHRAADGRKVRYVPGPPVDAAGTLATGESFKGFQEFQTLLLASADDVARCVTVKLLTFATGREMGFSDRSEISRIVSEAKARNQGMRDLLHAVVQSPIFLTK
ncbi:MAG: DUF1592 domain-containing protein [Limisphaerales bacterium]